MKTPPPLTTPDRTTDTPALRAVAAVIGAHGLKGELRLRPFSHHPDGWWRSLGQVHWQPPGAKTPESTPRPVRGWRMSAKHLLLCLEGITDRTQAETARGGWVLVDETLLPPLEEGKRYWDDWMASLGGLALQNSAGQTLAHVREVLENPAHPILVVQKPGGGEAMVPLVEPCFASRHPQNGVLVVADEEWFHAL